MTTIISDAGVQFAGGNIVDVRSTVPTSGTYTAGDFILEASTSVKVTGWKRLTTGSGHVLNTDWAYVGGLTLGTAASASGTAVSYISLPSWINSLTLNLFGISITGASDHLLAQIGTGGSPTTSGYSSSGIYVTSGTTNAGSTAGVLFPAGAASNPTITWSGYINVSRISAAEWSIAGTLAADIGAILVAAGRVTLAGQLDNIRLTTNGASTFDAGKINISYQ